MTQPLLTTCSPAVAVREIARGPYREYCLTARGGLDTDDEQVIAQLATTLAELGCEPLRERWYGSLQGRKRLLAARHRHYAAAGIDANLPYGYLEGAPLGAGEFAGVQIMAVQVDNGSCVRTVEQGRLWQGPGFRVLCLVGVHGAADAPLSTQAEQMFLHAQSAAASSGFAYPQTVRTWIYLPRLLDWYGEFNHLRSAFYRSQQVAFPASTGIQAKAGAHECEMDLLLVDGLRGTLVEQTCRQGPASAYGSAFARGVVLEHAAGATLHVSGTASIDSAGRSLHLSDASAQAMEMLLAVAAVLAEAKMELTDIQQATLFCKSPAAGLAFNQAVRLLRLAEFPQVQVRADVCRSELLLEMEAIAWR